MNLENVLIMFLISLFVFASIFHPKKYFTKIFSVYALAGFLVFVYYIREEIHAYDDKVSGFTYDRKF